MFALAVVLLTASTTDARLNPFSLLGKIGADILTAEFAAPAAELPLCDGQNDLLPVTFTLPVDGEPLPEQFEVTIGTIDGERLETVQPNCATLAPANEADERQTVLLLGNFFDSEEETGPISVKVVGDLSLSTGLETRRSVEGRSFAGPKGSFLFFESGPRIVSADLLNVPSDSDDENACSVAFPETTAVIRLLFGSGVRENSADPDNPLVPLGNIQATATDPAAALARIQGMFEVYFLGRRSDQAELLGLGDVDVDNVVDLCLKVPAGVVIPFRVGMTCVENAIDPAADFVVRDPTGDACARQTVRVSFARFDFFAN